MCYDDSNNEKILRFTEEADGRCFLRDEALEGFPEREEDSYYGEYITPYMPSRLPFTSDPGLKAFFAKHDIVLYSGIAYYAGTAEEFRERLGRLLGPDAGDIFSPEPAAAYWMLLLDEPLKVPNDPLPEIKVLVMPVNNSADLAPLSQTDALPSCILCPSDQLIYPEGGYFQVAIPAEQLLGIITDPY